MAAGSISVDEFLRSAKRLCAKSDRIGDTWQLKEIGKDHLLCKRCDKQIQLQKRESGYEAPKEDAEDIEGHSEVCDEDPSALETLDESLLAECSVEYHIVYSTSYAVPVLYFNINKPDGSLISLEEMWNSVPACYKERLSHERWTFLTQQEHPLLGRPYFQLHPCHTATLMQKVLPNHQDQTTETPSESFLPRDYLVSWLSSVAGVVHLDFPLEYAAVDDN